MKNTVAGRNRDSLRTESGVYMIELLMTLVVGALLSAALVNALSNTQSLASTSQNEITAAVVAQEQIDNVRNASYDSLTNGTYPLLLHKRSSADAGPTAVNPRPLMYDLTGLDWRTPSERAKLTDKTACAAGDQLQNLGTDATVSEIVEDGPAANTKFVTIKIAWSEGSRQKHYVMRTLIAQNGIRFN